jgi:UDP-glucose 4-epimerase
MPGVTVRVTNECVGCGLCAERGVCFVHAVSMKGGQAAIGDECRGCGKCVTVCPYHAIELTMADLHVVDRSIERLSPLVDVT